MLNKLLIVIAGPTAVGKTDFCIRLAQEYSTEIISADSRQFYKEMTVGTAKPSEEDLAKVTHHFIDSHSIFQEVSAGQYEAEALQLIEKRFLEKNVLILTGGSGLFIDAITKGFDEMPEADPDLRTELNFQLEHLGLNVLLEELKLKDPEFYEIVDKKNPRRILRAVEVIRKSGIKYSEIRKGTRKTRAFHIVKFALDRPREELYQRINDRVDIMMRNGLLDEVKSLYDYRDLPPLKTVGYTELFDFMEGKFNLNDAVELIKRNTRRYAKRQLTWFRRDEEYQWSDWKSSENIISIIRQNFLK